METVVVKRDGKTKLRVPAEVRNGVLRCGKNILINVDLINHPWTKKSVAAAIKAKKITPEIEAMGMFIGDNGNGLVVRWASEIDAEVHAARQAAYDALPAEVRAAREERRAINDQAEHEDSMAVGALTYDCDGSISPEAQNKRHDEFKAKAKGLRAEAAAILAAVPDVWK